MSDQNGAVSERIGVIGAGYVGLVTGVCLASLGYQVTLRDIDATKVAALNDGQVPIYEPGLAELMAEHRSRLTYTLSLERMLERSDIVFIAVDTPPTYSGDADLSRVMGVVEELQRVGADSRHILVMKSTVPVGTGERVRAELDARGLDQVGYCSNPEFLKEGAAIADFLHPDRVVIGSFDEADGDRVASLYAGLDAPIIRTTVPSAEMVKYASNAFLATKISFINEIANVCEEVGADVDVVATPTSPTPAFLLGERTGDPLQMYLADVFTVSAPLAGLPAISVPCGFTGDRLPLGLQLTGPAWDEATLFRVADAYERATPWSGMHPIEV